MRAGIFSRQTHGEALHVGVLKQAAKVTKSPHRSKCSAATPKAQFYKTGEAVPSLGEPRTDKGCSLLIPKQHGCPTETVVVWSSLLINEMLPRRGNGYVAFVQHEFA